MHSGSTSHHLDPDVIEIPTPITHNPAKQKEAIFHDVIDVDNDDDSAGLVLNGEKVGISNKGKKIEGVHDGYGDHQVMDMFNEIFHPPVMEKSELGSGMESSNGYTSAAHNLNSVDDHGSDQSCDEDDYSDLFSDDYMDVDDYALLQAHFDNVDIPPGIEAPIPWLAEYDLVSKKTGGSSLYPLGHIQSDAKNACETNLPQIPWSLEPTYPVAQGPSVGSSSLQIKTDSIGHPSEIELSSAHFFSQTVPSRKKSDAYQCRRRKFKFSLGESSKPHLHLGPSEGKKKHSVLDALNSDELIYNSETMKVYGGVTPYWGQSASAKKAGGSSGSHNSNFVGPEIGSLYPPGIEVTNPWWFKSPPYVKPFTNSNFFNHAHPPPPEQLFDNTLVHNGSTTDNTVVTISDEARDEILRKFGNFKQFDTIEDTSDHYFVHVDSSVKQHSKNWAKRIQEEWKSLEKDLPDSIFVRVYESRIDILRAVIIGAEGTPYHDGLFFFDVFFPSAYPNIPPHVHYNSGGLRLNPNLYNCGKVCLSLLNTWSGSKNEKWLPGVSTILQVLVSIQGLILNAKPYFNEPGFARSNGSASGETKSLRYNEDIFILSLRTMVYMIRNPPKNFEEFVAGHFCSRAHDILIACKAYMDGAQVGCLVKGGVQDVDQGDRSCSKLFKNSLAMYVNMLVREFARTGAKDCDKFLSPLTTAGNKPLGQLPEAAATFS
ncbi:hypothetical protein TanjilG_01134 [Lupinus angustifolius]|uniref:E2 ubiquitin-conjugating enzyme n=1 Tax=Lupinus angustifolius TaxID=3871 RepID=A0A1J7GFE9_LUPAN|nr:PREDICTED: probable ubiquitin-conjugating enzyme E2 26 isoform X2 [Lupinus angustifolius]OIV99159.1 hypothetical protein TanjilG_01134 [Lupinus angustifolius]